MTTIKIKVLKSTHRDPTLSSYRLYFKSSTKIARFHLGKHILPPKTHLLPVDREARLRAGQEKKGSRSQRKICLAPPCRRLREERANDDDDGHNNEENQGHNNGGDSSGDGQGSGDPSKVVSQPPEDYKITHNQRILVSVKTPDGMYVPLYALVRFDVKKSFIYESVSRELGLEVHPVPLQRLNVHQTHLGYFTPHHFARFEFTYSPPHILDIPTDMFVMDSIDSPDHFILGTNFLEQALGYTFHSEENIYTKSI